MRAATKSGSVSSSPAIRRADASHSGAASVTTTEAFRKPSRLALALAALPLALHLAAHANYDFFGDERYFIVCGWHPAWGYVDQPPLVPLPAAASQTAGESLWLLRIGPALFHDFQHFGAACGTSK
jgi:hypothetical protein